MSIKDKTRQKLVESMRKTKATATEQAEAPAKQPAQAAASAKQPPAAPARERTPRPAAPLRASQPGSDPYQSAGRIWPD